MNVGIVGAGVCLPEKIRTNDYWPAPRVAEWSARLEHMTPDLAGQLSENGKLTAQAMRAKDPFQGGRERRVIAEDQLSSDIEAEAAKGALSLAGITPEHIDLLLSHSLVPDYLCCNNSSIVHHKLGLRRDVMPSTVDAMCLSVLVQFQMARRYILEWTGSLSSANIPTQLHLAHKEGLLRRGDIAVVFTVASGMNVGAAVMRWAM
jgi:3-oxoacyl-[acyl-carrier-protein] synthase III